MPETDYYESSYRRERERDAAYSSDDDDRYKKTTVRRYKVGPDRVERVERTERFEEAGSDPRRERQTRRSSNNLLEVDRRDYVPERPRSAFEATEVSRRSDRDRDYYNGRDDIRTVEKRRDFIERDSDNYGAERSHRVVYEKTKEIDRDVDRYPRDRDGFARVQRRGERDDQIVVESYSEDRRDDGRGGEVERWHKETEYYEPASPAPAPIVIRSRPAEQKIILQEAPAPAPVIVPRQQPGVIVIREKDRHQKKEPRHEDEYYYERREHKEVGPYRGEREEDVAITRYERRGDLDRPHRHRHHHRGDRRDYASDGEYSSDDDYYVKRTVIRRETSPAPSNHRLHLAEGALAGAGLGALLGSRRNNQTGELPEHRGRKVLAGAALGALGTEVFKRAHSAYNERFGDDNDRSRSRSGDRNRSRSTSRHHSKLKTGLGIAAAALAVAGAAKYMQSNRIDREERNRGRSLHRYSGDEDDYNDRSLSRNKRKSRSRSVAKVAAGTAAVAGLVHHFRSKSRGRDGKARSHSRLRTGAEIAAAGLAGAAAKKLYDKHKDKKELEREREREFSEDEYADDRHSRRSGSRSRSRSRSAPPAGATRSPYPPAGADPELGLVEYGAQPLYSDPAYPESGNHGAANHRGSYDSAADASDREDRRQRRHRHRAQHGSAEDDVDDSSYADIDDNDRSSKRNRSRSRLRNLAAAGAGAAAAAIGIKKYEDKKKRDEASKRDRDRNRDDDKDFDKRRDRDRDEGHDRSRHRDKSHRHRDDDDDDDYDAYYNDYDNNRPPSPPHASGGAFYPPAPPQGPPVAGGGGLMQHPNAATTNINEAYLPYHPVDYSGYPPPPGPPPAAAAGPAPAAGPLPTGPPPPAGPPPTQTRDQNIGHGHDDNSPIINPRPAPNDGDHVSFAIPLSQDAASLPPGSSRLRKDIVNKRSDSTSPLDESSDAHFRAVGFAPLSPQSSRTLRRHHAEINDEARSSEQKPSRYKAGPLPLPSPSTPTADARKDAGRLVSLSNRRQGLEDEDGEAVEVLPDRFDPQGRPLFENSETVPKNGRSRSSFSVRRGDFEYKNPTRADGWHVQGQWGVAGNDVDGVERLAGDVRSVIDGLGSGRQSSIASLIGGVLGGLSTGHGGFARGNGSRESGDDERKRKRRNTYDATRGDGAQSLRDKERFKDQSSASAGSFADCYVERDDDGHDPRKRRRSWAS